MHFRSPNYCNHEAYELFLDCIDHLETNDGLLGGAIAISRHFLDASRCESVPWSISAFADAVFDRVNSRQPIAVVSHLHEVLFEENEFTGNSNSYYDIDNSLLPVVLETRLGLPITLTLIYKVVAEEVGLRVEGINSPGHFLARVHLNDRESMVVDAFHSGRILTLQEAMEMVTGSANVDLVYADRFLPTCTHRQWLARILNNLQSELLRQSRMDDVSAMRELLFALLD